MVKYLLLVIQLAVFIPLSFGNSKYINLKPFMSGQSDELNDIGYLHFVPQYEENMQRDIAIM